MSLYQKIRPTCFDEIVGNESTVSALQAHFAKPREMWSHCFLFSGPAGCAKTTLAQIVASILGADEMTILDTSSFPNRFGVDAIRDVLERVQYMPIGGSAWVVLIDEAHKLSKDAKGAMLIPTENCPDNVYYILTTTNVQQFARDDEGAALMTRMSRFQVESLNPEEIFRYLRGVARRNDGKHIPEDVLRFIAEVSDGSMRQALVDLEKIIPLQDEKEMRRNVTGSCMEETGQMKELFRCFLQGSPWGEVADVLKGLKKEEPEKIRRSILAYFTAIMLNGGKDAKRSSAVLSCFAKTTYDSGFSAIVLATWELLGD